MKAILDKLEAGAPLDFDDGVALFRHRNLAELGLWANAVRERLHGDRTYYNLNLHLNPTNVCVADCRFCSFARLQPGEPGAYTMTLAEAWQRLATRAHLPLTEIHIVGGLHPDLPLEHYEELLRGLKRIRPDVHLKAFTAVEIHWFAQRTGLDHAAVLRRLMAAGLGSLPGGGAEIFADRVRRKICADKASAAEWLAVHRAAHQLGLRSNATMLYGHIETVEERVDHLLRLRALQDETGGFQTFIPLAFHPEGNALARLPPPGGFDDLRTLAVARLVLHNIAHLKAYWIMLGVKIAQAALAFGVDDLDGTVEEERIYHMAGARSPEALTRAELEALIRAAGREPVERDTLYRLVPPREAARAAEAAPHRLEVLP
jgi:aminodeoxyfutalosine synthase